MLYIQGGIAAVVVVAHQHLHGQALPHVAGQVAVVLGFHRASVFPVVVGVDLVAHGEQEVVIHPVGGDGVQGFVPAVGVAFIVAGRTDLGVAYHGDVQAVFGEITGGVGVGFGLLGTVLDVVLVRGIAFQAGDGDLVDGVPPAAGRLGGSGVAHTVKHQGVGGVGGVVPHKVHFGLVGAHVHYKIGGSTNAGVYHRCRIGSLRRLGGHDGGGIAHHAGTYRADSQSSSQDQGNDLGGSSGKDVGLLHAQLSFC